MCDHQGIRQMIRSRRGQIPLKVMIAMFIAMIALLAWNTWRDTRSTSSDGRQEIVAWGITFFGDEIYTLIHQFEQENPQYKVIVSSSAERDTTSDGQRLLCAVAGGVPPDVYFFARFATGEWASRNALTDLGPMLAAQDPNDPHRINLDEYYPWAIKEASYRPPGSNEPERIYSIPTTGDIRMLYFNKDLLRQAGLVDERGEPRSPKTWDELREYANRLTVYRTPGDKRSASRGSGLLRTTQQLVVHVRVAGRG
jgi:ABC-type glycerol-3-phosphate transport system substrate-binding protein